MPQLALAPWEILPTIPVISSIETLALVPWGASLRQMVIHQVAFRGSTQVVFVRPVGITTPGYWGEIFSVSRPRDKWKLARHVRKQFTALTRTGHCRLGRIYQWHSAENLPSLGAFISSQECYWFGSSLEHLAPFEWEHQDKTFVWDAQTMKTAFEKSWNDENADLRFSFLWCRLSPREKWAQILGDDSRRMEMKQVMMWILRSTDWIWEWATHWQWSIPFLQPHFSRLYNSNRAYPPGQGLQHFKLWQTFLISHFVSIHAQTLLKKHLCIEKDYQMRGWLIEANISSPPTAHERLEAKLELRDWMRTHLSLAEMIALQESDV